jgi:hypothetical protein
MLHTHNMSINLQVRLYAEINGQICHFTTFHTFELLESRHQNLIKKRSKMASQIVYMSKRRFDMLKKMMNSINWTFNHVLTHFKRLRTKSDQN